MLGNSLGNHPAMIWNHTKMTVLFSYHLYVCYGARQKKLAAMRENYPAIRLNIHGNHTLH
jgi:hypothetical protein